jgi:hypothetical protein
MSYFTKSRYNKARELWHKWMPESSELGEEHKKRDVKLRRTRKLVFIIKRHINYTADRATAACVARIEQGEACLYITSSCLWHERSNSGRQEMKKLLNSEIRDIQMMQQHFRGKRILESGPIKSEIEIKGE